MITRIPAASSTLLSSCFCHPHLDFHLCLQFVLGVRSQDIVITGVHDCSSSLHEATGPCASVEISVLLLNFDPTERKVYELELRALRHRVALPHTKRKLLRFLHKQVLAPAP